VLVGISHPDIARSTGGHWRLLLRVCRYDAPVHWWRRCPLRQRRLRRITIQTIGAAMVIKRNQMMGAFTTSLHYVSEYSGSSLTSRRSVAEGPENCRKSTDLFEWTIARAPRLESTALVLVGLTGRLSGSPTPLNKEARSWRVRSKRVLSGVRARRSNERPEPAVRHPLRIKTGIR
jgi:hypothetical protein